MRYAKYIFLLAASLGLTYCTPKMAVTKDKGDAAQNVTEEFRSSAPAPAPAPVIQIGEYEQFTLNNGLTVIVVENHKIPRVSWQMFVDVPPGMENDKVGISDIAGNMLSRGTENRSKGTIDQEIDYIGASLNTNARGFFAASLTKHQDKLLNIASDVLLNPSFPEDEFQKVIRQTMSGLAQAKNDPNTLASSVGDRIIYGADHPYGEIESEATVRNITPQDCKEYYASYFKPNNSFLVVVGDIDATKAKAQAEKYFGKWQAGPEAEDVSMPMPESPGDRSVSIINKEGAVQSVLRLAFPYQLKPGDPDAIKVSVMNTLLGGFFNSRVNLNLREDKGYTYGARTSMGTDQYVADFQGTASVRNEVTDSAVYEFLKEIERLQTEMVGEEELDLVKSVVTGNFALSLERPQTIANFALNTARYNLPEDYYKNYLKQVSAITPEDIQEMANKYLQPYDLHIIVVGNEEAIADKLKQFDDSGIIDYYDSEGNKLEKNAVALPSDLSAEDVVRKYLDALGTPEKRNAIKAVAMDYTMEAMGTTLQMKVIQSRPDKYMMSMMTQGMEVTKQVLNGDKGLVGQMGQMQAADEESVEGMRSQASIFEEEYYLAKGYTYELKSIESVDGVDCYKLTLSKPSGNETVYFAVENGLKMRSVQVEEQNGQTATIIQDFKNYQPIDGVLFPHSIITSGALPVPLEAKLSSAEVNPALDENIFKVGE